MTLKVDEKADALYLRLDDSKIVESQEVSPGVILDFNTENQPLLGSVVGAILGARFLMSISNERIRILFVAVLGALAVQMFLAAFGIGLYRRAA